MRATLFLALPQPFAPAGSSSSSSSREEEFAADSMFGPESVPCIFATCLLQPLGHDSNIPRRPRPSLRHIKPVPETRARVLAYRGKCVHPRDARDTTRTAPDASLPARKPTARMPRDVDDGVLCDRQIVCDLSRQQMVMCQAQHEARPATAGVACSRRPQRDQLSTQ